jgi:hypothetical protein
LFFLQLALIWFGYTLEKMINRIYKGKKRTPQPGVLLQNIIDARRVAAGRRNTVIILFFAWSIFSCIRGILFYKMAEYQKQLTKCAKHDNEKQKIPDGVWAVVLGQFFSFMLFGMVQSIQFLYTRLYASKTERMIIWIQVSKYYSILSVTSKTILDITLLAFIITAQSMQCSSDAKFSTVQPWPAVQNAYFHSSNVSCT